MPLQYIPSLHQLSSSGFGGSGPVLAPDLAPKHAKKVRRAVYCYIDELAGRLGATSLSVLMSAASERSLTERWGVNPLVFDGFDDISTHSCVVDLSATKDQLWSGLSELARMAIKKALGAGYTAQRIPWDPDGYYEIHCETYTRTGVQPHPREYFEGIARYMEPRGASVLWAGFDRSGTIVAFHNSARHRIGAYYHTGCSVNAHWSSGVNYLLMWESILDAREQGYSYFEVGEFFPQAKDGKELGLSVMKSKFGGEVHRYFRGLRELIPAGSFIEEPVAVVQPIPSLLSSGVAPVISSPSLREWLVYHASHPLQTLKRILVKR